MAKLSESLKRSRDIASGQLWVPAAAASPFSPWEPMQYLDTLQVLIRSLTR